MQSVETGAEHISRMTEDAASPSGVRDWIPGDALKKVHWKLTMRKRELMVRTYEESARPDTLLLVDLAPLGALMKPRHVHRGRHLRGRSLGGDGAAQGGIPGAHAAQRPKSRRRSAASRPWRPPALWTR